ncbi:GNAT family N-acetyltransferase [Planktotalea sp.]|uniref:GNAT family N-acetyltransferase n=1 Tax=Planktotalea sp. TaxID=2029877 RepID=UPI00329962B9
MNITIRAFQDTDVPQMTELLNEIIEVGGTTAYLTQLSEDELASWVARGTERAAWNVAIDETDRLVGFQWAEPHELLPPEAASIASFVRIGVVGAGIGSKLFEATSAQMRAFGFEWINASIRSDNDSGLRYYSKMGFKDWQIDPDAKLSDGRVTGKTHKRFDL